MAPKERSAIDTLQRSAELSRADHATHHDDAQMSWALAHLDVGNGLHVADDAGKLACTTALLLVQVVELGTHGDGLTEVDAGRRDLQRRQVEWSKKHEAQRASMPDTIDDGEAT